MTTIRDASPADIDAVMALEERCFSLPWPRSAVAAQIEGAGRMMLAAERGGAFAGYMGVQYVLDEGYITNVCTAPEHRRAGVASALLAEMRARAERLGLGFLTLEVRESNAAARALYAKHGYIELGRRKSYYERPAEDAVIMTLYLKEAQL